MRRVAALDIGGAHLKAVGPDGHILHESFQLWSRAPELAGFLTGRLHQLRPFDVLAVTMTGELCDSYATKAEGVLSILEAVQVAAGTHPESILVWRTDGHLTTLSSALEEPLLAAAANWLALAEYCCRHVPSGPGVLLDVGSTTTDVVPLLDGVPVPRGRTDLERLAAGELIYSGVSRTPVAAIAQALPYRGTLCPIAAETFSTSRDVYLLLGMEPENPDDRDTPDGREATRSAARERLARMFCADGETFFEADALAAAAYLSNVQVDRIRRSLENATQHLGKTPETIIISGAGEHLARAALEGHAARRVSLAEEIGQEPSAAACAYALQQITAQRLE